MMNAKNGAYVTVRPMTFNGQDYAAGESIGVDDPKKARSLTGRGWIQFAPATKQAAKPKKK